ncbi:MAG: VOC family protein [Pseudomonadota bacterium]
MTNTIDLIEGLTISTPVSNLDTSIAWYEDILGFKLLYRVDEIAWCEMSTSVSNVNLGLSEVEKPTPGGATPTFGVSDINAAKSSLEAKGVRIDGDIMVIDQMVSLLTFYDPDNNALMFYQEPDKND